MADILVAFVKDKQTLGEVYTGSVEDFDTKILTHPS
jgi:hypothetical protein